jgi:rubrerythrin
LLVFGAKTMAGLALNETIDQDERLQVIDIAIELLQPEEEPKMKLRCSKCKLTWYDKEDDAKCPDCGRKSKCLEKATPAKKDVERED